MLRRIKLGVIIAAFLLLMAGCNLNKKIGESITEGLIEKVIGDDVDINIDGDEFSYTTDEGEVTFDEEDGVTFKGEDGSIMTSGGDNDWPEGQAAEYLPKMKGGTIDYILNTPETCMLIIDETELEDYKDYVEAVIDMGYTIDKVESSAEDMQIYSGKSEDEIIISVIFMNSEGSMQITLDASGKQ